MGGGREVVGGGGSGGCGVSVVLLASDVSKLESALDVVDRHGYVNTSEVKVLTVSAWLARCRATLHTHNRDIFFSRICEWYCCAAVAVDRGGGGEVSAVGRFETSFMVGF